MNLEASSSSNSKPVKPIHRLWHWFIAPSSQITEPDQRRQAVLLSALLLVLMVAGGLVEALTIPLIDQPNYTGYWDTLAAICFMAVIYGVSRTQHIRLASILAIFLVIAAILLRAGPSLTVCWVDFWIS